VAAPPNIVWFLSDQHRADVLGAAGHPVVQTPNLDGLASEGTLFESAYCQGPLCVPARVSLLTERYVRDHGAASNRQPPVPGLPTMVQAIRDAGYHTAAIGKMHLYPHRAEMADGLEIMHGYGFTEVHEIGGKLASGKVASAYTRHLAERGLQDSYRDFVRRRAPFANQAGKLPAGTQKPPWAVDSTPLPTADYIDSWTGAMAARWIDNVTEEAPFFLWVGFPGPHDPWDAPAEYVERYRDADIPLDTTRRPELPPSGPFRAFAERFMAASGGDDLTDERIREVRRHYFANVTLIDDAIGGVLDALRRRRLDDNTWVIYSTDHGEMLGTHGLLHKMLFYEQAVRVPLIIRPPGGGPARRFGGLVEHVDLSATLRAVAQAGEVRGSAGRSLLPALTGQLQAGKPLVVSENFGFGMWRTERYKLVVYEPDRQPAQLFDLAEDPAEERNLVTSPAHLPVIEELMDAHVCPFLSAGPHTAARR
jgi:arylsulfatase